MAPPRSTSPPRVIGQPAHEARQVPTTTAHRHDPRSGGGRDDRTDAIAAKDSEPGHG